MNQEDVYKYARREPFKPFRLVLTTGAVFDVRRRDQIMLGTTSIVVGVCNWPGGTTIDRTVRVDHVAIATAEAIG